MMPTITTARDSRVFSEFVLKMVSLRIEVLEQIPENPELRAAWSDLVSRVDRPQVFYTFEWAIAVQRAYARTLRPLLILAYAGEVLVGVASLAQRSSGEVVFLGADTGDYCEFLSEAAHLECFAEAVFRELKARKLSQIVLTNVPADSGSAKAISLAAEAHGYRVHRRTAYLCAQVILGAGMERAEVKEAVLAKKRLRRNMRELQKRGKVRVDHETAYERIEPLLPEFVRTHVLRFLENGKVSVLVANERRVFIHELTKELCRSGWIALSRLLVNETTAAWHYGFRFAGSWFWYQPTLSQVYSDFSPGYCLLAKIIELACDSPDLDVVDLGLGAEGYKERFTTATRETLYFALNQSLAKHLQVTSRSSVAHMVMRSPRIENATRRVVGRVSDLKARLRSEGVVGSSRWAYRRLAHKVISSEQVLFFQWPSEAPRIDEPGATLKCLDGDGIGAAAIRYEDDPVTLRYLMRCAQRLPQGHSDGYVLLDREGIPVHFCWAKPFQGFEMAELDRVLTSPVPNATMIFDCFTPFAKRGHGYFSQAIRLLAEEIRSGDKSAWIFGAATNTASVQGIRKTEFEYQFTLGRRRTLFVTRNEDSLPGGKSPESKALVSPDRK